jgi:hypothetical protein
VCRKGATTSPNRWYDGVGLPDLDLCSIVVGQWIILDSSDGPLRLVAESDPEDPARRIVDVERWIGLLNLATAVGALTSRPGGEFFDPVTPVDDDGDSET